VISPVRSRSLVCTFAIFLLAGTAPYPLQLPRNLDDPLLQDLEVLTTRAEFRELQKAVEAGPQALDVFLEEFWARRDPTPGTRQNEFRARFEARCEVADNQLIPPESELVDSRRQIYLLYGTPSRMRNRLIGASTFQSWDYFAPTIASFQEAAMTLSGSRDIPALHYSLSFPYVENLGYPPRSHRRSLPRPLNEKKGERLRQRLEDSSLDPQQRAWAAWRLRMDPGPEAMAILLQHAFLEAPLLAEVISDSFFPLEIYRSAAEVPDSLTSEILYRPAISEPLPAGEPEPAGELVHETVLAVRDSTYDPLPLLTSDEITYLRNARSELTSMPSLHGWLSHHEADALFIGPLHAARELIDQGRGEEAHALLTPLLRDEESRNAEAWHLDAIALMTVNTPAARQWAEESVRQAMRLDQGNVRYWLTLAKIQFARTMKYYTEDTLDRALREAPGLADIYALKGQLRLETYWGLGWHASGWWVRAFHDQAQTPQEFRTEALTCLSRALTCDPRNEIATWYLGVDHLLNENWIELIPVTNYLIAHDVHVPEALLGRGLAYQHLGYLEEAMVDYAAAIPLLSADARALITDPRWTLQPSAGGVLVEGEIHPAAQTAGDSLETDRYWRAKDQLFSTDVNERLLEQYRRFAHVTWHYARTDLGMMGWDTVRGRIYLRYGEPERVQSAAMTMHRRMQRIISGEDTRTPAEDAQTSINQASETWRYRDGTTFTFGGGLASGNLTLWPSISDIDAINSVADLEEYAEGKPDDSRVIGARDVETVQTRWYSFRNLEDGGPEYIPVLRLSELQNLSMQYPGLLGNEETALILLDDSWQVRERERIVIPSWIWNARLREVWIGPAVRVSDPALSQARFAALEILPSHQTLPAITGRDTLGQYRTDALSLSSPLLASSVIRYEEAADWSPGTFLRRGDYAIIPDADGTFSLDEPVYLYVELYGLSRDEFGASSYQLSLSTTAEEEQQGLLQPVVQAIGRLIGRETQESTVTLTFHYDGIDENTQQFLRIAFLEDSEPGSYGVTIRVTDQISGATSEQTMPLRILR